MTPDLQQEFRMLSEAAEQRLKNVAASEGYRQVFSVWIMPSFSPSFRWTVFSPTSCAKGSWPFASYSVWRSDLDWQKFASPVERLRHPKDLAPTIEDERVWLTPDVTQDFEQRIRAISIPFFLRSPSFAGCDGTRFEFHYDELLFGGSIHWWEDHPEEWRPFTEAVAKIVIDLDNRRKLKVQPGTSGVIDEPPSVADR